MTIIHKRENWSSVIKGLLTFLMLTLTASTAMAMSENVTMQVGETKTLNLPSSFTSMYPYCKTTTWLSYGNEYVSVISSTLFSATVKANKAFSSPIIVRCNYYYYLIQNGRYVYGGTTFYDFVVTVEGSQPTAITLSPSNVTLDRGQSVNLKPVLTPSNATTSYSWSTSNAGVATVDNTGHVIGQNSGEATITCRTANGLSANCFVTVRGSEATNIRVSPSSMSLTMEESSYVSATLSPSNTSTTYSWQSDNTSVVKVNSSGKVTAVGKGSTRVTATTSNGLSDYCYVTVSAPAPSSVSIKGSTTLNVGESETLTPTLSPSNAETSYTWTSSNYSIVSVSSNGTVKAIAPGTAKVTVKTDNGKTANCQVTVSEQEILPTSITMTDCLDLTVGDEYRLTPTISPANATNTTVNWSSSDMAVATVKNGLVKAEGKGTCYISATTSNGLTAKCYVVVSIGNTDDNDTDITEGWEGSYQFTADVTRFVASEMPFNEVFDMTITQKEDDYYITSMMGCNTVFIIYEGLKLNIIDASHAEIVLRYNNCLGNPINGGRYSNFHELNPDDEFNYINNQVITIIRHSDGTTKMSDFNIYAFGSETDYEYLREAKYRGVIGSKMDAADIKNVLRENDSLEVFDLNGRCIYRGQKVEYPRLDKGMYIFKSGEVTRKVFVR